MIALSRHATFDRLRARRAFPLAVLPATVPASAPFCVVRASMVSHERVLVGATGSEELRSVRGRFAASPAGNSASFLEESAPERVAPPHPRRRTRVPPPASGPVRLRDLRRLAARGVPALGLRRRFGERERFGAFRVGGRTMAENFKVMAKMRPHRLRITLNDSFRSVSNFRFTNRCSISPFVSLPAVNAILKHFHTADEGRLKTP